MLLSCGVALKSESEKEKAKNEKYLNGHDKIIMALLSFFLGGIGIHNFMMGETKKGIFKIVSAFCCGLGFIFGLIDFIKILCGSYVVDPNKLI